MELTPGAGPFSQNWESYVQGQNSARQVCDRENLHPEITIPFFTSLILDGTAMVFFFFFPACQCCEVNVTILMLPRLTTISLVLTNCPVFLPCHTVSLQMDSWLCPTSSPPALFQHCCFANTFSSVKQLHVSLFLLRVLACVVQVGFYYYIFQIRLLPA